MDEAQASTEADENVVRWFFVANPGPLNRTSKLKRSRTRTYLYESLHRCMTKHNQLEAFQLLRVLPKDTYFDPYALLRLILILIESSPSERMNKNVIIYLEALISKLDISKPDAFIEFLTYFIKNNRINDAKELFNERHRYMMSKIHRPLPYIDVNVRSYELYLNYLTWNERIQSHDIKPIFDLSTQGWLVNAIDCLKTTTSTHEFFVICLLKVLLYYGYYRKAYLFMSEFQRNNPNNLSAQLIHYNLLNRLRLMSITGKAEHLVSSDEGDVPMPEELSWEQRLEKRSTDLQAINNFSSSDEEEFFESDIYPFEEDRTRIMKNLRILDPGGKELMDLSCSQNKCIESFQDLMDGLEIIREISNISRWRSIQIFIESIEDKNESLSGEIRLLWHKRYRQFWKSIDMMSMISPQMTEKERGFIKETYESLITFLDKSNNQLHE